MATKARLHWFWRGAIAATIGLSLAILPETDMLPALHWLAQHMSQVLSVFLTADATFVTREMIFLSLLPILVALATYGLLTRWLGGPAGDGELHCRRCNYILRGLSEPRCPECGEAI